MAGRQCEWRLKLEISIFCVHMMHKRHTRHTSHRCLGRNDRPIAQGPFREVGRRTDHQITWMFAEDAGYEIVTARRRTALLQPRAASATGRRPPYWTWYCRVLAP